MKVSAQQASMRLTHAPNEFLLTSSSLQHNFWLEGRRRSIFPKNAILMPASATSGLHSITAVQQSNNATGEATR